MGRALDLRRALLGARRDNEYSTALHTCLPWQGSYARVLRCPARWQRPLRCCWHLPCVAYHCMYLPRLPWRPNLWSSRKWVCEWRAIGIATRGLALDTGQTRLQVSIATVVFAPTHSRLQLLSECVTLYLEIVMTCYCEENSHLIRRSM